MFGKNALLKQVKADVAAGRWWVQEVFPTIQGEGPLAGMPAVFLRLAGCNLACHFCDTDFESSAWHPPLEELLATIHAAAGTAIRLVVITGGEPFRQPLAPLIAPLLEHGYMVQLETAGTLWDPDLEALLALAGPRLSIVCSPKTGSVNAHIAVHCAAYKYIVRVGDASPEDGLPVTSTQTPGKRQPVYRPTTTADWRDLIWIQPCEEYRDGRSAPDLTKANIDHAVALCMRYGYRLSLQIHKVIGMP